jgi:uncharacterized protein
MGLVIVDYSSQDIPSMDTEKHVNRLAQETSPYLLQHAHNPVDWHAWNAEALEKAREEDKPILLSVGYSACHWCHVMEHESFEDENVANVMNELFVCIKVDREERPDLDKIYQVAHQFLTSRPGGWPLNMFLTPADHMPFFGGTYFPKTPRHGLPGFTEVLRRVAGFYRERRQEIEAQNASLRDLFTRIQPQTSPGARIGHEVFTAAAEQLKQQFDPRHGGFGQAPKFPHSTSLDFCLRHWNHGTIRGEADDELSHIVRHTLRSMARGGLYDQLGGGFCRYSVDERWMIPHFEKMLYDNALLLPLYTDTFLAYGDDLFRRVATETAEWVMREMQAPDGGYYSTLDADSEGEEGKFYAWRREDIKDLMTPEEYEVTTIRFGLDQPANFEDQWHLHVQADTAEIAAKQQRLETEVEALLGSARTKLFKCRELRVHPGRDEKILTSWNGLMIKAMAHAGRLLGRTDFIDSAERAFDFIRATLWRDGKLLATYRDVQVPRDDCMDAGGRATQGAVAEAGSRERPTAKDGKAHLNAYLDDHVFLIDAGLELIQARWRDGDLEFVLDLADYVLQHFEDKSHGGFYFTADDHERLVHRPKPTSDDATPSGNGVAASVLWRLAHLLGETRYAEAAERTLEALFTAVAQYPSAHGSLLLAAMDHLEPMQTIVLRGNARAMTPWLTRCQSRYTPQRLVLAIPEDSGKLPGLLAERVVNGEVTAYVCRGQTCGAPIDSLEKLETELQTTEIFRDSVS